MELIFDKAIDDCRERVFARVDEPPPTDPTVQPNSGEKEMPLLSAATQSTTVKPSSKKKESKLTIAQSVQTQDTPSVQPPQPLEIQPEVKNLDFHGLAAAKSMARSKASTVPDRVPTVGLHQLHPQTKRRAALRLILGVENKTGGFSSAHSVHVVNGMRNRRNSHLRY